MITKPSLNILNVLLIQIKMTLYDLHLLLSMAVAVLCSRDYLKFIIELYKKLYGAS